MHINKIKIRNFRCFKNVSFDFSKKIILIEGNNGSGKTTILEALYYSCYLKSFRTHASKDLPLYGEDNFFVQLDFEDKILNSPSSCIQVGFSNNTKLVRLNHKAVSSYKEIVLNYRVISSTEEDVLLVSGGPDVRRNFLNQYLMLGCDNFIPLMRDYKKTLLNRNNLLLNDFHSKKVAELKVWTEQLWKLSLQLQTQNLDFLQKLQHQTNNLLNHYFSSEDLACSIEFLYEPKNMRQEESSFDDFWNRYQKLTNEEFRLRRTLFGVHLDDFSIKFKDKKARSFASRGQQKLVVFLAKIAKAQLLINQKLPVLLLFDDFLTDFDERIILTALNILDSFDCQIFITTPLKSDLFLKNSNKFDVQLISL